jgi:predicted permease
MRDWLADVRFVLRGWRRTPGFSATIVLTLALGLGLASAIFAFADGYLFRPLPFPGAEQTYFVTDPNGQIGRMLRFTDTQALRRSSLAHLGFVEWSMRGDMELVIGDRVVPFFTYDVSPGFRKTLQIPLVAGRDFSDDEHRPMNPMPVWLSHRFWTRELAADPAVLGRTFATRGRATQSVVVVGIMGPEVASFDLNNRPPDGVAPELPPQRIGPNLLSYPLVRLPEGMTAEQGTALIGGVLQSVAAAADGRPRIVRLRSLTEIQLRGGEPTARVLFAGAMLVLLLAAINLVHLLLTRGVARAAEVATRAALGASPWRVTRLFLTESLLFGGVGIAGGLLLGRWLSALIEASIPQYPTASRNMALVPMLFDWRVVGFAVALGIAIALAGGIWPARRAARRTLTATTRSAAGVAQPIPMRLSRSILASELAVATVVMLGTLFIGLGIWRYLNQPLGFETEDRFQAFLSSGQRQLDLAEWDAVIRAVSGVPGVKKVGPFRLPTVEGVEVPGQLFEPKALRASSVSPGYFEAWQTPLILGRWFTEPEYVGAVPVAMVDELFARRVWPDASPLGQQIRVGGGPLRQVVGVVASHRFSLARDLQPYAFVPGTQQPEGGSLVVWASGVPLADLRSRVSSVVSAAAAGTTIDVVPVTFEHLFLREIGEAQFQAPIMAAFGVLAFLIAGIGVFGLVSYLVEQRRREFGIRLTLGARPAHVWRSVIRQSVVPAVIGLAVGVGGAWALESVVRSSVFGWQSSGIGAVSVVTVALLGVAVLAAAGPARRAMRIDPATTLRME